MTTNFKVAKACLAFFLALLLPTKNIFFRCVAFLYVTLSLTRSISDTTLTYSLTNVALRTWHAWHLRDPLVCNASIDLSDLEILVNKLPDYSNKMGGQRRQIIICLRRAMINRDPVLIRMRMPTSSDDVIVIT